MPAGQVTMPILTFKLIVRGTFTTVFELLSFDACIIKKITYYFPMWEFHTFFKYQLKKRVTGHTRVFAMPSKSRHNNAICWRHLKVPITSLSPIPSLNTHFNFQLRSHAVSDFTWFNNGGGFQKHIWPQDQHSQHFTQAVCK